MELIKDWRSLRQSRTGGHHSPFQKPSMSNEHGWLFFLTLVEFVCLCSHSGIAPVVHHLFTKSQSNLCDARRK